MVPMRYLGRWMTTVVIGDAVDEPVDPVDCGASVVGSDAATGGPRATRGGDQRERDQHANSPGHGSPRVLPAAYPQSGDNQSVGDRGAPTKGRADFGAKTRPQIVSGRHVGFRPQLSHGCHFRRARWRARLARSWGWAKPCVRRAPARRST
jgi:hypothetical protein